MAFLYKTSTIVVFLVYITAVVPNFAVLPFRLDCYSIHILLFRLQWDFVTADSTNCVGELDMSGRAASDVEYGVGEGIYKAEEFPEEFG